MADGTPARASPEEERSGDVPPQPEQSPNPRQTNSRSTGNHSQPQGSEHEADSGQLPPPPPLPNAKACKPFDDFGLSFKPKPGRLPVFLLVDRGDCYFTTKGWNAQNAGAAAVLVADDKVEPLITMDSPESSGTEHIENITIPSALVTKRFGDDLRKALQNGDMVNVLLDWRESLPHPDERVEYEFWTNSNDECGAKCDMQMNFVRSFRGVAQALEKRGYTQFTPHYITWYCPEAFILSKQCKSQCINHGRYCAPDPEQDFSIG